MTLAEYISACFLVIAAAGVWLNWLQLRRNAKQRRAEWLARMYGRYCEDGEMAAMFQRIEYKKFEYRDDSDFHDSNDELTLDRLLEHYEAVAMVYDLGMIEDSELKSFRFQFRTVYKNAQVLKYLQYLDEWFAAQGMPEAAFLRSRGLAAEIQEKFP